DDFDPALLLKDAPIVGAKLLGSIGWEKLEVAEPVDLFPGPFERFRAGLVDVDIAALEVLDPGEAGQMLREPCEALLTLPQSHIRSTPLRLPCLLNALFQLAPQGQVFRHHQEAARRASLSRYRREVEAGPEAAAILANTPADLGQP